VLVKAKDNLKRSNGKSKGICKLKNVFQLLIYEAFIRLSQSNKFSELCFSWRLDLDYRNRNIVSEIILSIK